MRTTRAPNNGKNAPPVRACRFARACIAREDRPRRGKAPWQTARFACRLARCACRSSSQKSHFAAIFGSPIFFPSWVSAVYLTFRQSEDKGASCALSSCLGLYLKPHPFTFRQRETGKPAGLPVGVIAASMKRVQLSVKLKCPALADRTPQMFAKNRSVCAKLINKNISRHRAMRVSAFSAKKRQSSCAI